MKFRLNPYARAILALSMPGVALAGPVGGDVTAGQAVIARPDEFSTVIDQGSRNAVIQWQSFNLDGKDVVVFHQPSADGVALNRVTGGSPSEILGHLSANGRVFLINPAGVMFGQGAQVDVGGLVATTMNLSDADFLAGRYVLKDAGPGAVSNAGTITTAAGGFAVLAAEQVRNSGLIQAKLGDALLASGQGLTLNLDGTGLISYEITQAAVTDAAGVTNLGQILAEGGRVVMTADLARQLATTVVNNQGLIAARGIEHKNGEVWLTAHGGSIEHAGTIDASSTDSDGGIVQIRTNQDISLNSGSMIEARGGGESRGGVVQVVAEQRLEVQSGASLLTAGGTAGLGGFIEVSGHQGFTLDETPQPGSGGLLLIDPAELTVDASCSDPNSCVTATNVQNLLQDGTSVVLLATGKVSLNTSIDATQTKADTTAGDLLIGIGAPTNASGPVSGNPALRFSNSQITLANYASFIDQSGSLGDGLGVSWIVAGDGFTDEVSTDNPTISIDGDLFVIGDPDISGPDIYNPSYTNIQLGSLTAQSILIQGSGKSATFVGDLTSTNGSIAYTAGENYFSAGKIIAQGSDPALSVSLINTITAGPSGGTGIDTGSITVSPASGDKAALILASGASIHVSGAIDAGSVAVNVPTAPGQPSTGSVLIDGDIKASGSVDIYTHGAGESIEVKGGITSANSYVSLKTEQTELADEPQDDAGPITVHGNITALDELSVTSEGSYIQFGADGSGGNLTFALGTFSASGNVTAKDLTMRPGGEVENVGASISGDLIDIGKVTGNNGGEIFLEVTGNGIKTGTISVATSAPGGAAYVTLSAADDITTDAISMSATNGGASLNVSAPDIEVKGATVAGVSYASATFNSGLDPDQCDDCSLFLGPENVDPFTLDLTGDVSVTATNPSGFRYSTAYLDLGSDFEPWTINTKSLSVTGGNAQMLVQGATANIVGNLTATAYSKDTGCGNTCQALFEFTEGDTLLTRSTLGTAYATVIANGDGDLDGSDDDVVESIRITGNIAVSGPVGGFVALARTGVLVNGTTSVIGSGFEQRIVEELGSYEPPMEFLEPVPYLNTYFNSGYIVPHIPDLDSGDLVNWGTAQLRVQGLEDDLGFERSPANPLTFQRPERIEMGGAITVSGIGLSDVALYASNIVKVGSSNNTTGISVTTALGELDGIYRVDLSEDFIERDVVAKFGNSFVSVHAHEDGEVTNGLVDIGSLNVKSANIEAYLQAQEVKVRGDVRLNGDTPDFTPDLATYSDVSEFQIYSLIQTADTYVTAVNGASVFLGVNSIAEDAGGVQSLTIGGQTVIRGIGEVGAGLYVKDMDLGAFTMEALSGSSFASNDPSRISGATGIPATPFGHAYLFAPGNPDYIDGESNRTIDSLSITAADSVILLAGTEVSGDARFLARAGSIGASVPAAGGVTHPIRIDLLSEDAREFPLVQPEPRDLENLGDSTLVVKGNLRFDAADTVSMKGDYLEGNSFFARAGTRIDFAGSSVVVGTGSVNATPDPDVGDVVLINGPNVPGIGSLSNAPTQPDPTRSGTDAEIADLRPDAAKLAVSPGPNGAFIAPHVILGGAFGALAIGGDYLYFKSDTLTLPSYVTGFDFESNPQSDLLVHFEPYTDNVTLQLVSSSGFCDEGTVCYTESDHLQPFPGTTYVFGGNGFKGAIDVASGATGPGITTKLNSAFVFLTNPDSGAPDIDPTQVYGGIKSNPDSDPSNTNYVGGQVVFLNGDDDEGGGGPPICQILPFLCNPDSPPPSPPGPPSPPPPPPPPPSPPPASPPPSPPPASPPPASPPPTSPPPSPPPPTSPPPSPPPTSPPPSPPPPAPPPPTTPPPVSVPDVVQPIQALPIPQDRPVLPKLLLEGEGELIDRKTIEGVLTNGTCQ